MLLRRVAGISAAFLMIQLVLAGSELTCPRHDVPAAGEGEIAHHDQQGTHHHGGDTSPENPEPDQHPAVPDCCQEMATCSSGAVIQSAACALTAPRPSNDAFASVASMTLSRVESPDPPPPKA